MSARPVILASAQALFPKSAKRTVIVVSAWHPDRASTPRPEFGGSDGWTPIGKPVTRAVLDGLRSRGFTWVTVEAGGTAIQRHDVPIASLL